MWNIDSVTATGQKVDVGKCSKCNFAAHVTLLNPEENGHKIHSLPQLRGKTCFEIMHSPEGRAIWKQDANGRYNVQTSHPTIKLLRRLHGLDKKNQNNNEETSRAAPSTSEVVNTMPV